MPELPEVETTRRGIAPHLIGQRVAAFRARRRDLRRPIPSALDELLGGQEIKDIWRRGKYLGFQFGHGVMLVHLGMSGSLRLLPGPQDPRAHEHWDLCLGSGMLLRYRDPRRFGSLDWLKDAAGSPWLRHLGPEPFDPCCDGRYLHRHSRGRKLAVKNFIMDARNLVGVGNIYANEALYRARIRPDRAAGRIGISRYEMLINEIRATLQDAIDAGGSTLRDFLDGSGEPGYFQHQTLVYGRQGEPCDACGLALTETRIGGRTTVFCRRCQR